MYKGINHLAFITNDLDRTVRFWRDLLEMPLVVCIGEDEFRHYFFQVSPTDMIAFFQYPEATAPGLKRAGVPTREPRGFDHVAIGVESREALFALKDRLENAGVPVEGVVDHGLILSIYIHDPNNLSLEFCWQCVEVDRPPVIADPAPTATALEGAAPRPEHWPARVEKTTSPTDRKAKPGAGASLREVAVKNHLGRSLLD
jgi:catechol 2,3-dioxygenase-like lactoylglutathione lyase family enzyme